MMRTISCSFLLMQLELSLPWRHFIAVVPVLSSMSSVFISDGTMSPTVRNSESYISSTSSFIINDDEALVDIKSPSASTWKYQGSYSPDQMPPSDRDNQLVQMAFKDFDAKRFEASDKEFTIAIAQWRKLHRPRDEIVSLLKARGDVRVDNKHFDEALGDYNECISLMKVDGEDSSGLGKYPEYPDAFVGRALAYEGLAEWALALQDYNKAISLWGGIDDVSPVGAEPSTKVGLGINPYVLSFRGNVLTRLNRYEEALLDYERASNIFIEDGRDIARYSDARANYALTLYQLGRTQDSVKTMNDVIRKNPGYADMHVALAAHYWSEGDYITALKEWRFTCDRIEVGCDAYKDRNWVSTIRRWPVSLSTKLQQFLDREIPDKLKGIKGSKLAPCRAVNIVLGWNDCK